MMRLAGHWLKDRAPRSVRVVVGRLSRVRDRKQSAHQVWTREIDHEADYWRTFLRDNPSDVAWRLDANATVPKSSPLYDVLSDSSSEEVSILDVGAGPLTPLGHRFPGKQLRVTAIDPLADAYDGLLAEAGIDPPVRTVPGEGERLLDSFPPASFDIACAMNALDHSYEPLRVIENMVEVVKPGGVVVLYHRRNEAEHQLYRGLHRWNFDCVDDDLVVWAPGDRCAVGDALADRAHTRCWLDDGRVVAILERRRG